MIICDEFVTLLYFHFKYHMFILVVGHGFIVVVYVIRTYLSVLKTPRFVYTLMSRIRNEV